MTLPQENPFFLRTREGVLLECWREGPWITYVQHSPPGLGGRVNSAMLEFMLKVGEWKLEESRRVMN